VRLAGAPREACAPIAAACYFCSHCNSPGTWLKFLYKFVIEGGRERALEARPAAADRRPPVCKRYRKRLADWEVCGGLGALTLRGGGDVVCSLPRPTWRSVGGNCVERKARDVVSAKR
jgi:hypothetical protein